MRIAGLVVICVATLAITALTAELLATFAPVQATPPHIQNIAYDSILGPGAPDNASVPNEILRNILSFGEDTGTGFAYAGSSGNMGRCSFPCRPGIYVNLSEAMPDFYGDDVNVPFHSSQKRNGLGGACPSTVPHLFASGVFQETDFYHAAGTSVAPNNRIASSFPDHYVFFWHKGSPHLLNFVNDVLQNCMSDAGTIYNNYMYLFADNTDVPMSSGDADFGGYFPGVAGARKNVGHGPGPWVSAECIVWGTPYFCTQTDGPRSPDLRSTLETPTDTAYDRDIALLYCNLQHRNGTRFFVIFNGAKSNYVPVSCPSVLGGVAEGYPFDNVLQPARLLARGLDAASGFCNTVSPRQSWGALSIGNMGGRDAGPSTASGPFGSKHQQNAMRVQMAYVYLSMSACAPDRTLDWPDLEGGQKPRASEWPYQFFVPTGPTVHMLPGAGGRHGAADLCVDGTYPNCVYAAAFTHCFWQPHYGSPAAGRDMGPCAVELNLSGKPHVVEDTDFQGLRNDTLTRFVIPCKSSALDYALYVDDPKCAPNSAGDVMLAGASGTGPGILQADFAYKSGAYAVANRDGVILVGDAAAF
jgi:hypothetical protein